MTSIKLELPPIKEKQQEKHLSPIEGKTSVVLIGANGSGKTRMSVWIEKITKVLMFIEYLPKNH